VAIDPLNFIEIRPYRYPVEMQKSGVGLNPVPGSGLWSESCSKVNQFVHVRTSVEHRRPWLSTHQISSKSIHNFFSYPTEMEKWCKSGSWIRTMIRIWLKSWLVRPCTDICRHTTFHPNPCTRFWVFLLTDRQTNIAGKRIILQQQFNPAQLHKIQQM